MEKLLLLLRSALYGRDLDPLAFSETTVQEWQLIFTMARQSAVVSLCFDALSTLPKECRPPRAIFFEWLALSQQKQEHNRTCIEKLAQIAAIYRAEEVDFLLLKGLAIAQYYPVPKLRDGGDIDLLITGNYIKSNELMLAAGAKKIEDGQRHYTMSFEDVVVENHKFLAHTPSSNQFFKNRIESEDVIIEGATYKTLAPQINAIYLCEHIAYHILVKGVGLRHLSDLALFFTKSRIDSAEFSRAMVATRTERIVPRLFSLLVDYFEVDSTCLPVAPIKDVITALIFEDIVKGGNFGNHNKSYKKSKNKLVNKYYSLITMVSRLWRYRKIGLPIYRSQFIDTVARNFQKK